MTDATLSPKRPPVSFLSQADISAFLSQLAIAEMDAADRADIELALPNRSWRRRGRDPVALPRDARLAAIAEMDAERDRLAILEAGQEHSRLARLAAIDRRHRRDDVRRAEAAVEMLRREVIGDRVRRIRDEEILAACRALASRALTGYGL
jgi:hypothetical protein